MSMFTCAVLQKALAFNKYDGSLAWERHNGGWDYIISAVDDRFFYSGTSDSVVARNKGDGQIQWGYPVPDGTLDGFSQNGLAVSDSFLCFVCWKNDDGKAMLYMLDKFTGTELWRHTFDGEGVFPPVLVNRVVYLTTYYGGELFGFDVRTGDQVFYRNDYWYSCQPIVASHRLYVSAGNGIIVFENEGTPVRSSGSEKAVSYGLLTSYPNPFNAVAEIEFTLRQSGYMALTVFNIHGQEVQVLFRGRKEAGTHRMKWDANMYSAGIYLCRLEMFEEEEKGVVLTLKLVLQK